MTTTVITIELSKWHTPDDYPESANAKLFGELVKLATPVVESYHSDLYYDAHWIGKYVPYEVTAFYYAVRNTGTSIGQDKVVVNTSVMPHEGIYYVEVYNDNDVWKADITEL